MIVLDSDILIEMIEKNSEVGQGALDKIAKSGEEICTTVINLHEVLFGMIKRSKPTMQLTSFPTLDYKREDAILSAELENITEKKGAVIRRTDAMVAATVMNNNAKLYTLDKRHFRQLESEGLELF